MADYAISNVPRRVVYAASGTGPYAFTFEILNQTDIAVYKASTLLTLTTDYTVTINANGTGSVTLVTTAGTSNITIVGSKNIQRTTDFTTGGDLFANTLNDELDNQTIFIQQVAETAERGLKAPVVDPTDINMTLPAKASRVGTVLAFNATTGNPEAGPSIGAVTTVAAQSANINTVATNIGSVNTVAGNITNVNTVAGVSSNVTTVASNIANVNAVGADLLEGTSEINTVAVDIANVNTVGTNIASVNTVAGEIGAGQDVTVVAANLSGTNTIGTVATNIANVNATGTNIANVNAVGSDLLEAVSEINTVATDITNVNTVGTNIGSVNTVAGISSNVSTVAGISANVTTVAGINSAVSTVASNNANVTTVATNIASVNTCATDIAQIITTANDLNEAVSEIEVCANNIANINTVGTNISNVNTVAGISANVTIAAANVADINNFADVYQGAKSTDPTLRNDGSALQPGDLYFNTTDDVMKVREGGAWLAAFASLSGALIAANNLSDLTSASTARTNLGLAIGTNVQAYDAQLADIAGLTPTDNSFIVGNGTNFVAEDASTARTSLGLGTIATQAASSVAITGGSINGTTVGATTASTGRFSTLEATGVTTASAGSVSAPAITTTGDTNTGIYFPAADTIAFTEGGVEALRLNSNGQTATSIAGTASLPSFTRNGDENTGIFFPAADTIAFAEGGTEAMRIDSSGNVGIAVTTVGTNNRLSVQGVVGVAGSATGTAPLPSAAHVASSTIRLGLRGSLMTSDDAGLTNIGTYLSNNAFLKSATGNPAYLATSTVSQVALIDDTIRFRRAASGTADTDITFSESMRIDSTGRAIVGHTAALGTGVTPNMQVKGTGASNFGAYGLITTNNEPAGLFGIYSNGENSLWIASDPDNLRIGSRIVFSVDGTDQMQLGNTGFLRFNSGYGSVETAYGCRAWINFNGTGTIATRASGNVSSIGDNGTGDYTVNFATAMPDANYACNITCEVDAANPTHVRMHAIYNGGRLAGSVRVRVGGNAAEQGPDAPAMMVTIHR